LEFANLIKHLVARQRTNLTFIHGVQLVRFVKISIEIMDYLNISF